MKKLLILVSLTVMACATGKLLSSQNRKAQFITETTISKTEAYNQALSYFAKNMGDSNAAIKVKDKSSAHIVLKGNTVCNRLRQTGDINDYLLQFSLDFKGKNNKVRLKFEDLHMTSTHGGALSWSYLQITSVESLEKVKPCIELINRGFINSMGNDDF